MAASKTRLIEFIRSSLSELPPRDGEALPEPADCLKFFSKKLGPDHMPTFEGSLEVSIPSGSERVPLKFFTGCKITTGCLHHSKKDLEGHMCDKALAHINKVIKSREHTSDLQPVIAKHEAAGKTVIVIELGTNQVLLELAHRHGLLKERYVVGLMYAGDKIPQHVLDLCNRVKIFSHRFASYSQFARLTGVSMFCGNVIANYEPSRVVVIIEMDEYFSSSDLPRWNECFEDNGSSAPEIHIVLRFGQLCDVLRRD